MIDAEMAIVNMHKSEDSHRRIIENGTDCWDCYGQTSVGPWRGKYLGTITGWEKAIEWLN